MSFGRRCPRQGHSLCNWFMPKKEEGPIRVGGQAVIEGVMMRAPHSMAIAVRKPSGEIVVKREELTFFSEKNFFFKLPLVRGVIALMSALALGIRALHFSANQAIPEEEGGKEISSWTMGFTFALALSFGIVLFFLIPLFLTKWLKGVIPVLSTSGLLFNLVDGPFLLGVLVSWIQFLCFFNGQGLV